MLQDISFFLSYVRYSMLLISVIVVVIVVRYLYLVFKLKHEAFIWQKLLI